MMPKRLEREAMPHSSKVMAVEQAVHRFVEMDDQIFIDERANAGVRALIRAFDSARFSVITLRGGETLPDLLAVDLVREAVAATLINRAIAPPHIESIQTELGNGRVRYEPWSLLTISLRLEAGALGLPFMPTRCLAGSSLQYKNPHVGEIVSPFTESHGTLVVAPLKPDVAIVHALASDQDGRALFAPPYPDGMWGARASRKGVIVTAEKVVGTAKIKAHPEWRMLPAARVLAVCPAEFGCYPYEYLVAHDEFRSGYHSDGLFLARYAEVVRERGAHREWVNEEIRGRKDEAEFRRAIGAERLERLRVRANRPRNSTPASVSRDGETLTLASLDGRRRVALMAARRIVRCTRERGVRTALMGNGLPHLAVGLASILLNHTGDSLEFCIGSGLLDVDPIARTRDELVRSCGWAGSSKDTYALALGGEGRSVALLSAGQIDAKGNLNSSRLNGRSGRVTLLAGSGGANDAAALADVVIVLAPYRRGRFVKDVDYVTCPGDRVNQIICEFGVMENRSSGGLLLGTKVSASASVVDAIASDSGWRIEETGECEEEPELTAEEVTALNILTGTRE